MLEATAGRFGIKMCRALLGLEWKVAPHPLSFSHGCGDAVKKREFAWHCKICGFVP